MRIDVNKHWQVYLDFGRAGSLSLQLYWTYHRLLHMRLAVKSHALPVYKKNRIASLLLSCQPRVTVTSCFVYKVIRDLESIYHLSINPIHRIGLILKWSIDSRMLKWRVHVSVLLSNCKQSITPLSLLVGTTVCIFESIKTCDLLKDTTTATGRR